MMIYKITNIVLGNINQNVNKNIKIMRMYKQFVNILEYITSTSAPIKQL